LSAVPDQARMFSALEATWPPAERFHLGPWVIRNGLGGGKRVSATTTDMPVTDADIEPAERQMRATHQTPLFMVRNGQDKLDRLLAARGYQVVDPSLIFCADINDLSLPEIAPLDAIPCAQPLSLMEEIWQQGGIGPARLAVMQRVKGPKSWIFGRANDRPAGVAFVAIDGDIAMLHALQVVAQARRAGAGRRLMARAALWAAENGARHLSVVTTGRNLPAQRLFSGIGMQVVGKYHYRTKE